MAESVLVFGGTGNYGLYIVKNLVAKSIPVKVFTRNADRARKKLGDTPKFCEGDVLNHDDIVKSLTDTKAIIISLSAMSPKLIRKQREIEFDAVMTILDEAEKHGIRRIVFISIYDIRKKMIEDLKLDVGLMKMAIEERLLNSNFFNATILGCPPSFLMFAQFVRKRVMIVPGGGAPLIPSVAPQDVGDIAAQASIRDDLDKKRFRITYSNPFSFPEVAQTFSKVLGRKIKYMKLPLFGLKIASIVTYPFNPFVRHLLKYIGLLNNFPTDLAEQAPEDHQILMKNFEYSPTSLEEFIRSQ